MSDKKIDLENLRASIEKIVRKRSEFVYATEEVIQAAIDKRMPKSEITVGEIMPVDEVPDLLYVELVTLKEPVGTTQITELDTVITEPNPDVEHFEAKLDDEPSETKEPDVTTDEPGETQEPAKEKEEPVKAPPKKPSAPRKKKAAVKKD